ncbi:asparaginase [Cellulomonas sp. zg-ZUI188]|uniref:Asparaginase n=1 Tax=Cellulomonas fengjieae TaxID=2819978 RepID=A0ABS3SBP1_9CELL|nr:asparaginase [Cellulomonas fengjieae]QVI65478.1 asparaginase [Cellulomonas fengjieae]
MGADRPAAQAGRRVLAGGQADQALLGNHPRRRDGRLLQRHPGPRRAAPAVVPRAAGRGRGHRVPGRREARRHALLAAPRTAGTARRRLGRLVSVPDIGTAAVPLARVLRGGLVESVHFGHVVVLAPDGSERLVLGDADATVWARSSLKPLQAVAMLRAGLDVDGVDLALVCASHNGEPGHLDVVRGLLAGAGLGPDDLHNTPDWPLDADSAWRWRAEGHGTEPLTQNCSGKHAGMLATCVAAGWPTADYLDPEHPLQRATRDVIAELTGVPVERATVDGCGAPLFSTTLRGLARSFGHLASGGGQEGRVGRTMATHPWHVAGTGRDATRFMEAVPGLVAKDGADGVYAAGLADGGAVALKIVDGSSRPRPAVLAAALTVAGVDPTLVAAVGLTPVLGHGAPVGEVLATFGA